MHTDHPEETVAPKHPDIAVTMVAAPSSYDVDVSFNGRRSKWLSRLLRTLTRLIWMRR
jgi:hypothetical protein